jgi:hypothetical protein
MFALAPPSVKPLPLITMALVKVKLLMQKINAMNPDFALGQRNN